MQTNKLERLQLVSSVLGIAAVGVYLLGFTVVSIFDGSYGVTDFSLFRTKAVAAGILFAALAVLGVLITFRTFRFLGLRPERVAGTGHVATPKNRNLVILDVALSIPYTCLALTVFASFLFVEPPAFALNANMFLCFVPVAITGAIFVWGKPWFAKNPISYVAVSSLSCVAFFWLLNRYGNAGEFWFTAWLSLVCWFTLYISLRFVNKEDPKAIEWERLILLALPLVFGLYSIKVYPNLSHQFGGGSPIQAIFHLNKKVPSFDSVSVTAMLLDETEQGFYVVQNSDKSSFLTRGVVDSVDFIRNQNAQSALAPTSSALSLPQENTPMSHPVISGGWQSFVSVSAALLTPMIAVVALYIA